MLLAVRLSSYGCTWEVWRAREKLEFLSAGSRATLTLLSPVLSKLPACTHNSIYALYSMNPFWGVWYLGHLLTLALSIPFKYLFHIIHGCYAVHNSLTYVTFTLTAIHYLNYPDLLRSGLVAQSVQRR